MDFLFKYFLIITWGLRREFEVYGFKMSFLGIMISVTIISIVLSTLRRIFD